MTLEEAKAYLRIETAAEDALIARLVASARGLCEAFVGQLLLRREIVETVSAEGSWQRLGAAPVAAITRVAAVDGAGAETVMAADSYAIDIDPAGEGWVRVPRGRVRVTYRAGIAENEAEVPAAIAQGVTRLVAHLYAHRDDAVGPPAAVAALWRPFRRLRLGLETRA